MWSPSVVKTEGPPCGQQDTQGIVKKDVGKNLNLNVVPEDIG
jgi:hypothetical protein